MTRSAIPDPRDEACRERETVRLPRSMSDEIDDLVDEGRYPNRSAVIRAGARLLIKCEREDVWPSFGSETDQQGEDDSPDSLQEIAAANATDPSAGEPATAESGVAAGAGTATADSGATPAADGGMAGAVDVEVAGKPTARGTADDAYEFVAESPAVSEADIVTKLSSVLREATAGERSFVAS